MVNLHQGLIDVLINIFAEAVSLKKDVRVEMSSKDISMSFYQDKIGTSQYLEYYMSNTTGVESQKCIILSVKNKKDDSDSGYFSIKLSELAVVSIESDTKGTSEYTIIKLNDKIRITIKS